MILLYRILTTFLYPILILAIFFRKIKKKEDAFRYKEKIFPSCFNVVRNSDSKLIWFHAASVGEFKSILPIIEEINNNYKHIEFLVTTVNIIFLVDSEIWPNLIFRANKNKIPLSLINARITSKTFKKWMIFPRTAQKIFSSFSLCRTSNLETKNYLLKFNKENIYFNGNIKLINKIDAGGIKNLNEKFLLKNRFWLAASTHKGEEVFCLQTHIQLKNKYNDIVTIIAPRHIERVKSIKMACDDLNLNVQIINKNEPILDNKEIIIINSFGILSNYFKYAKSVFIGKSTIKSLENVGGQNPIDAAKLGCKIYHGPYVYNFKEVYEILKKIQISEKIENTKELSDNLIKDLEDHRKDNKKISVLINNLGQKTLADTMNKINNFLLNEIK